MVSVTGSAFVGSGGGNTIPLPPCMVAALSAEKEAEAIPITRRANHTLIIMAVDLGYCRFDEAAART